MKVTFEKALSSGPTSIGCWKIWQGEKLLGNLGVYPGPKGKPEILVGTSFFFHDLMIEPYTRDMNNHRVQGFSSLEMARKQINAACILLDRVESICKFQKDPQEDAYIAKHRGLEIGKIRRTILGREYQSNSTLKKDEETLTYYWKYYHFMGEPRTKYLDITHMRQNDGHYYWNLDPDLCTFLKIPYTNYPNPLELSTLKHFIRCRLSRDSGATSRADLVDIIDELMNRECSYRTRCTAGGKIGISQI